MLFHPFEIAFCGYSGSGKTTLIREVVRHLSLRLSIAYYKHGCHRFDIDREEKDSWVVRQAGANTVMISDPEKKALVTGTGTGTMLEHHAFAEHDLLIVEGLKELPLQKLLVVDSERKILDLINSGGISNVAALIVPDEPVNYPLFGIPLFQRDNIVAIASFIEALLLDRALKERPLHGLVLAGGRSSRMGCDKALLEYHASNQLLHTSMLLQEQCREVFLSCREDQAEAYRNFGLPLITDAYLGIGPLGGLLSAQRSSPDAAWIIAACDLPFLDKATIRKLSSGRDPLRFATAYRNPQSGRIEPLCACYEPKSRNRLLLRHSSGENSLAAFLNESRIKELVLQKSDALQNINNPDERRMVRFS